MSRFEQFRQSTFRQWVGLPIRWTLYCLIAWAVKVVGQEIWKLPPIGSWVLAFILFAILIVADLLVLLDRLERFYRRSIWYFFLCIVCGFFWIGLERGEAIVKIVTMFTVFLAFLAIDLAVRHEKAVRKVEVLIKSTFGLESYIQQAAQIYKEQNADRIVTSLRHWVARGDSAKWIKEGVAKSKAKKLVFVGTIEWNVYYPGVLWRFAMLRKILSTKGSLPEVEVYHVEEGVPLFVVSKRTGANSSDRGSLLVGNPMETAGINLYGINLGSTHPRQVDHYNFVFDTLICPKPEIKEELKKMCGIQKNIEQPYFHCDGIKRIFRTKPFKRGGEIYSWERVKNSSNAQAELIDMKAKYIAREIGALLEKFPHREEEKAFLPTTDEISEWAEDFLKALCDSRILDVESESGSGGSSDEAGFKLQSPFDFGNPPQCKDFFNRDMSA